MKKLPISLNTILLINLLSFGLISCNSGSSNTSTSTSTIPQYCLENINNFSSLESTSLIGTPNGQEYWGPNLANLPFPQSLAACQQYAVWNQARIQAVVNYWVGQKVNYCHHHVPTWIAESGVAGYNAIQVESAYTECNQESNVMQNALQGYIVRWNYSGIGAESVGAWSYYNNTAGYYQGNYGFGLDCSDYTKLIYSYAESIVFTSGINLQSGQGSQQSLAPNMAGFVDSNESDILGLYSAGSLVCADGTVAPPRGVANSTSCNGHGGYISVFESNGNYNESAVTDVMLNNLLPGDLVYISGCGSTLNAASLSQCGNNPEQNVTHVVVWTGQKIGSSLFISESDIAPETDTDTYGNNHNQCSGEFWSAESNIGNWIISDSHYQGPDHRAFTYCFYRNQVWGVRRPLQ